MASCLLCTTDLYDDFSSPLAVTSLIIAPLVILASGYFIFFTDNFPDQIPQQYAKYVPQGYEMTPQSYIDTSSSTPQMPSSLGTSQLPPQSPLPPQPLAQVQQPPVQQYQQALQPAPTPQYTQPVQQPNSGNDKYYSKVKELNKNIKRMLNTMNTRQ